VLASWLCVSVLIALRYREEIWLAMFPVVIVLTSVLLFVCLKRVLFNRLVNGVTARP